MSSPPGAPVDDRRAALGSAPSGEPVGSPPEPDAPAPLAAPLPGGKAAAATNGPGLGALELVRTHAPERHTTHPAAGEPGAVPPPVGFEHEDDLDSADDDPFDGRTVEVTLPAHGLEASPEHLSPAAPGAFQAVLDVVATAHVADVAPPPLGSLEGVPGEVLAAYDDDHEPLLEGTADLEVPRLGLTHDDDGSGLDDREGDAKESFEGAAEPFEEAAEPFEEAEESIEDVGITVEGAPVVDHSGTELGPPPPAVGAVLRADNGMVVRLEDSLGEQNGNVFYRARIDGEDQPFTAVWTATRTREPPWDHLPDPRVVRPRCRVMMDRAVVRVFERPKGNTVIDYLGDDDRVLPAMATLELGVELAELLESVHGAGQYVHDFDPGQIVIERGGRVRFYAVGGLLPAGSMPVGPVGPFSAPEVRRRLRYRVGAHSDVYAVALLLYALLARRAPVDIELDPSLLVSPRVFRPECPLGIWPYLRPCLEANPVRRVGHARALRATLEQARQRLLNEARAAEAGADVFLEGCAEQHIGLGKARRGSGQQDRVVATTDERGRIGFYLIADGVSRSRFGDGAFAAEQVEVSALQRWSGLEKGGQSALELNHAQRVDIMKQIARSAGKRISAEVNAKHAPLANEPNQVMSATMCAMFVVDGEATVGNLGDSRAYLVRDGVIEQITIDHDRCTDALRMGLSFREAAQVQLASALTRVVGRVAIDDDGTSRPDPFEPEVFRLRLLPGDRILIASDGVTDFAAGAGGTCVESDRKMLEVVVQHPDPARAAFELMVLANRAGGFDNISCVVVAVHSPE